MKKLRAPKPPKVKVKLETKRSGRPPTQGFLTVFKQSSVLRAGDLNTAMAKEIAKRVKSVIENQEFDWTPLSEKYAAWKEKKHLDPRIYVATKAYLNATGWWKSTHGVHVGVRPNVIHKPSGLPMTVLARIHEFGIGVNPARPLWRTVVSQVLRDNKRWKHIYRTWVQNDLRKKGFGTKAFKTQLRGEPNV